MFAMVVPDGKVGPILNYYDHAIRAQGWTQLFPDVHSGANSVGRTYSKVKSGDQWMLSLLVNIPPNASDVYVTLDTLKLPRRRRPSVNSSGRVAENR